MKSWLQTVLKEKRLWNFKFHDFASCCLLLKCFGLICLTTNSLTFMIYSKYFVRRLAIIHSFKITSHHFLERLLEQIYFFWQLWPYCWWFLPSNICNFYTNHLQFSPHKHLVDKNHIWEQSSNFSRNGKPLSIESFGELGISQVNFTPWRWIDNQNRR